MTTHAKAETLSAYLDGELVDEEVAELEAHLQTCPVCSERLAGMQRVVSKLNHLERMAPPSTLDQLVARRIALAGEPRTLADRLESSLGSFQRQSNLFMLFCLVIALAVITVLFAHALEKARQGNIPVRFDGPTASASATPPGDSAGGVVGGNEVDSAEGDAAQAPDQELARRLAPGSVGDRVTLGERTLLREGDGWTEEGLEVDENTNLLLQLDWESQAAKDLVEADPDLALLRGLGGPVLVRIDGRAVVFK